MTLNRAPLIRQRLRCLQVGASRSLLLETATACGFP
jgi:hypothetical protein